MAKTDVSARKRIPVNTESTAAASSHALFFIIVRFAVYTGGILTLTACLPAAVGSAGPEIFRENGPVEFIQLGLLACAIVFFVMVAMRCRHFREFAIFCAALCGFVIFRELDALLDDMIPVIGWKIGYLVLLFGATVVFRGRSRFLLQLRQFVQLRAFAVLWAAFIIAVPFAQLVGHGAFLEAFMGADYTGNYKRIIEEVGELVGYLVIVMGALETFLQLRSSADHSDRSAPISAS